MLPCAGPSSEGALASQPQVQAVMFLEGGSESRSESQGSGCVGAAAVVYVWIRVLALEKTGQHCQVRDACTGR